jgi:hypothetical protein
MRYEFRTSMGSFWIVSSVDEPDKVTLGTDQVTIGTWDSPMTVTQVVLAQDTGWERRDLLWEISGPRDMSEWKEIPASIPGF